jgi:hypothetical protein
MCLGQHFTGHCCWFKWGFGQHTHTQGIGGLCGVAGNTLYWVLLLVYVPPTTWGLGQHTLLGIVVGLCASDNNLLGIAVGSSGASGNIPILRVSVVYVASLSTHFTGYCCWFMWGIVVGYVAPQATHFTGHH